MDMVNFISGKYWEYGAIQSRKSRSLFAESYLTFDPDEILAGLSEERYRPSESLGFDKDSEGLFSNWLYDYPGWLNHTGATECKQCSFQTQYLIFLKWNLE